MSGMHLKAISSMISRHRPSLGSTRFSASNASRAASAASAFLQASSAAAWGPPGNAQMGPQGAHAASRGTTRGCTNGASGGT
eukprot:1191669-Prorocentrum_minimum.AAC.1